MPGENDYKTETVNLEDDSMSKMKMMTSPRCDTQLLESTIEDATNRNKTLSATMDSVISLMREVEHREKVAKQAVENIGKSSLDVLAKLDELKQAQLFAKEINQTRAKEVYPERDVLADEMDELQMSVAGLLTMGESSVGVLDEIRRSLEIRLMSALTKKEEAEKVNLNMEVSARNALAHQERQMEKEVQESEKLKRDAAKNSKMHEFLTQHGREVKILREEITCKCQAVNQLKVKFDYTIVQNDMLSSSQTPCEPHCEIID